MERNGGLRGGGGGRGVSMNGICNHFCGKLPYMRARNGLPSEPAQKKAGTD